MRDTDRAGPTPRWRDSVRARTPVVALGIFLLVTAVYALAGPGRIDIIDGQYRFEVARNLMEHGSLRVDDPFLAGSVPGIAGGAYSPYGVSGSIVSLPLLMLADVAGPAPIDRQQFFFSFTSAVFGAATASVLFLFYSTLGVAPRAALLWTMVAAFATLAFPASTSVFDQAQHALFVITACYLAHLSARRDSIALAAAGGAALAVLVNFQETYALLFPAIGLATLGPQGASAGQRRSFERYLVFMFVGGLGLLVWAGLNDFRFGGLFTSGKGGNHPFPFDNPVIGLSGLLVSPGKSLFLYSPVTVLGLLGLKRLVRDEPRLGQAVAAACCVHLALISTLSFYGGDWCWGPRYFVAILPLVALGTPFVTFDRRSGLAAGALVVLGLAVQLLGISLDPHRFFYERSLPDFFWAADRSFYFRHSALLARPGELLTTLAEGVPHEADQFRPGPYPARLTYAVFGPGQNTPLPARLWVRRYAVFWLPRPWPLWMRTIAAPRRPVDMTATIGVLSAVGLAGAIAVGCGLRLE